MRNIAVIDDSFDSSVTLSYHLSIQFGPRDFSFAILDTVRMKYIAYKRYWFHGEAPKEEQASRLRNILHADTYLTLPFHSVFFNYCSPQSVMVPSPVFDPADPTVYFRYSAQIRKTEKILDCRLTGIDSHVLFPVPEGLIRVVTENLHHPRIMHQSCGQIADALGSHSGAPHRVFVQVHSGFADLIAFKEDKLLIYNHFIFNNPTDLAYYILFTFQQLELPHEETRLILSGWLDLYPEALGLLGKYIRVTDRMSLPGQFRYSSVFHDIKTFEISPLINLYACES
jgi:hypothetical protein